MLAVYTAMHGLFCVLNDVCLSLGYSFRLERASQPAMPIAVLTNSLTKLKACLSHLLSLKGGIMVRQTDFRDSMKTLIISSSEVLEKVSEEISTSSELISTSSELISTSLELISTSLEKFFRIAWTGVQKPSADAVWGSAF